MEEAPSPPDREEAPLSPGAALRTGFASFNAASFYELQHKEKAANLLAAADALCPSSSDEDSSSASDGEEQEDVELIDQEKNTSVSSLKNKKQHLKTKRAKKHSKKSKEAKRRKTTEKESLSKKERRRLEKKAEAEFSKRVAAELAAGEAARKSSLHPFSTITATETTTTSNAEQQLFYSEKRPDPGNVAFGKLYRFDVPRYRRHDPTGAISTLLRTAANEGPISGGSNGSNVTTGSKKIEKQKERKEVTMWWRPTTTTALVASANDSGYLPLDPSKESYSFNTEEQKQQQPARQEEKKEKEEHYILQKTRDFNSALRQTPENLQIWLDFAAFQDEAMSISNSSSLAGSQKKKRGVLRATAEKQISILERGLQHHPGSDVLFLALLDVASKICDHEEMEKRWQQVLVYSPASIKLWKAYLMQKRNNFAVFKVGEVAAAHYQALSALKHEKMRVRSLLASSVSEQHQGSTASKLADLDNSLVEIALLAISFHFQTGYSELGVAAVRAVLEFNWFAPEGWPEDALETMFEEFYQSEEAKMLGDSGASGWGAWISGDLNFDNTSAAARKQQEAQNEKEEEPGGWVEVEAAPREDRVEVGKTPSSSSSSVVVSPWEEIAPAIQAGETLEVAVEEENEEEEEEPTDEQLLARLGMDLDAVLADAEEELTPQVLSTWLNMEYQRDSQQWKASRKNIKEQQQQQQQDAADENTNSYSLVTLEDLSPYLISIQHKEAREKLLTGCLQLLGVSLSRCLSSSLSSTLVESDDQLCAAASWLGIGGNSLDAVDPSALGNGRIDEFHWAWLTSGRALRAMPWWAVTKERHEVVLKILTTLLQNESLKDNYELSFATLDVASWSVPFQFSISATQEEEKEKEQQPTRDWAAGRTLAKQLLSEQRENLVLFAAFAVLEKLSGCAKAAKKVYLACFQSGQVDWRDAAVPAGLPELVLGVSQLELEETSSTRKESSSISFLTPISMLSLLRATPEGVHAASRYLFFLGSHGKIPLVAPTSANSSSSSIKQPEEEIIVARRGYQDTVLRLLRAGPETLDSQHAVTVISAAAAAELIFAACINDIGGGVTAALSLYKQVIDAVSSSSSSSSMFLDRIEIQRCALAVDAAVHAVHVVPPTLAREILSSAMQRYPAYPPLLRMLRSLEVNAHALTALRRQLNSLLSSSPSAPAWLMLIGVEIGANALRTAILTAFMRAVGSSSSTGLHSPLLWRCFLRFERAFGTPESLHRTFLRAVEACPWSKAVWWDGLKLLNGYCSPKELSEYLEILKNKEFPVRTDVLEAVLAGLE